MTMARHEIVRDGARGVYHCTARCVRRAFLCGVDDYTGENFEHRREWFQSRMKELNGAFHVEFLAYAIMSNHWHAVIRTRPDLADALSAEDVVRRWLRVFPKRREGTPEQIKKSIELEVKQTAKNGERVEELRSRLSSVSWFMKSMNEYIARRSNHEDGIKGRFWEGRFRCQRLLDEAAILACMAYVDLNPVRAKIAESLEDSEFTSAYDRLAAESVRRKAEGLRIKAKGEMTAKQLAEVEENTRARARAAWLVDLDGAEGPIERLTERMYLRLVDLTGRQIREGKRGHISPEVAPVVEALRVSRIKCLLVRGGSAYSTHA